MHVAYLVSLLEYPRIHCTYHGVETCCLHRHGYLSWDQPWLQSMQSTSRPRLPNYNVKVMYQNPKDTTSLPAGTSGSSRDLRFMRSQADSPSMAIRMRSNSSLEGLDMISLARKGGNFATLSQDEIHPVCCVALGWNGLVLSVATSY